MEWRRIPGWNVYEVSEFGDVRRAVRVKGHYGLRKPYLSNGKYLHIRLRQPGDKKGLAIPVAQLVLMA